MASRLRDLLLKHEGIRLFPYLDTQGLLTIGIGRCIQRVGISKEEAYVLLQNDLTRVEQDTEQAFSFMKSIDQVRADVVKSMVFNIGLEGVKGFHDMLTALGANDYEKAADAMKASKWFGQVGLRAVELTAMMRTGSYG